MSALVAVVNAEGAEETVDRRASVWQNPTTWVSILGFLLSLCVVVGGIVAKQLSDLRADVQAITISQTKSSTQQAEEIKNLQDKLSRLDAKVQQDERDQTAYNYDQAKMLTVIKTKMGLQ